MDTEIFEDDDIFGECMKLVSAYRREKVSRLRFRTDRNSSLAAGILLSHALREYAGIDESACTYVKGRGGKPHIVCGSDAQYRLDSTFGGGDEFCAMANRQSAGEVQFSLSHTDGLVAVIVGGMPCGIDTEKIRDFPESIVKRLFSEGDMERALSCGEDADRNRYCMRVWTRREAYGKLTGDGVLMNDEIQRRVMDDEYMRGRGVYLQNISISRIGSRLLYADDVNGVRPDAAGGAIYEYAAAICIGGENGSPVGASAENNVIPTFVSSEHLVLSQLKC